MSLRWESIAECLRQELADYGGLLFLFEEQQRKLLARDAAEVLRLSGEISMQAKSVAGCRTRREEAVVAFAQQHGRPATTTLRSLLPLIDEDVRPLMEALINEVNTLLFRVRRCSRHNHLLLGRTVDLHEQVLQSHSFCRPVRTYSPAGRVTVSALSRVSTLQSAG